MTTDIPDWSIASRVNLVGGVSGDNLGDVGVGAASADTATATIATNQTIGDAIGALASFKPAAGQAIAPVQTGPPVVGTVGAVNPAWAQAPAVGNLLLAYVTAVGGDPTTATAGWAQVVESSGFGQAGRVALWAKPNSAGGDPAPAFTSGGTFPMHAQLAEFSGVATVAPADQTAAVHPGIAAASVSLALAAADSLAGELLALIVQWGSPVILTGTFSEAYNNQATVTHAGDAGSGTQQQASSHSFGIVPALPSASPLGVRNWDYDAYKTNRPATGAQASVVFPAVPGQAYRLALLTASISAQTATAAALDLQVLDGAALIYSETLGTTAAIGSSAKGGFSGGAVKGTPGNSMTIRFNVGAANINQALNAGVYLG